MNVLFVKHKPNDTRGTPHTTQRPFTDRTLVHNNRLIHTASIDRLLGTETIHRVPERLDQPLTWSKTFRKAASAILCKQMYDYDEPIG